MTDVNRAVPIMDAAANDPAVQRLVEQIGRGEIQLSTPVSRYQPTEADLRKLDAVLDRIFGIAPGEKG